MNLQNCSRAILVAASLMTVGAPVFAAGITWTSATNGTWDTTTGNWTGGSPTANLYSNVTPDSVLFDDTGANTTVSLAAGLTPASVTVNNSTKNYTFQTSGFGGSGSLLKQGSGSLTLSVANSYSGGTTVSAGTLQLGVAGAAGSGAITLNDAGTGASNVTLNLAAGGGANYSNAITVANQGSGTTTIAFTTASTDTSLTTGTITLNRATTFSASSLNGYLLWSSPLVGSGPLTIGSTNGKRLIMVTPGTSTYTGDITVSSGAVFEPRAYLVGNNFTVNGTLQLFGNATINGLNGGGFVQTHSAGGASTLLVGNGGGSGNFAGVIQNGGTTTALSKTGAGTQVLSGASANTYTGGSLVSGGVLVTNKIAALGSGAGAVNVNTSGATLQIGDGSGSSVNTVTLGSGASLLVANGAIIKLGALNAGSLDTAMGVIVLQGAGSYTFNSSGKLNLNGVLDGVFTSGTHTYQLISGGAGLGGGTELSLANISGFNSSITLNSFTNGTLNFTAVPEPSTYGLIGAGALALVAAVRRRRRTIA
jgi:fibronectin-binding autotransporter adhesin